MGSKLPNTKVLQTYLQDLRSDRPQPTPARSLKPQESKVEQPALANASRSPDVRTAIDLESDESPSPKAATLRYSPSTPAESAPGSVAQKKEPQDIYTDVGIFGDFPDTGDEIPEYGNTMPRSLRSMNTTCQKTPFVAEQGVFLRPELMVARRCLRRSLRSGIPKGSLGRTWNKSLSNVDMIQNLYLNMGFYFYV